MRKLLTILSAAACLIGAPPASAAFTPTPHPCAGLAAEISGFAVSGPARLAICKHSGSGNGIYQRSLRLSRDTGQTWSAVPWTGGNGPQASGVTVGPDGAFWLGAASLKTGRLVRVDPASGTMSWHQTVPLPGYSSRISPPVWDAQGRIWVAYTDGDFIDATVTLARLNETGAAEFAASGSGFVHGDRVNVEVRIVGGGVHVRAGTRTYTLTGTTLTASFTGMPEWRDGQVVIGSEGVSLDGGRSVLSRYGAAQVEGSGDLLHNGGWVLRRHGPSFSPAGPPLAADVTRVLSVPGGFVAVADTFLTASGSSGQPALGTVAAHAGPLGAAPFALGPLNDTATGMLVRANQFRAQAGMAPLVGHPGISQSAENHSRYWTLNTPRADVSPHNELPGTPGFTGESMSERCKSMGVDLFCGSEIYGTSVDGWVATIYHRYLIMTPTSLLVGAGHAPGGRGVMVGGPGAGVQIEPVGFPTGRYDGPLSFSGESPDPVAECNQFGHVVDWPLGTAITAHTPGDADRATAFTVTEQGGKSLRGCQLPGAFLPDDPLKPGTTYTVTATWTPTDMMAARPLTWQFTTQGARDDDHQGGGGGGSKRCRPALRAAKTIRRGARIAVRYRACRAGRVKVTVRRRAAKPRRTLTSRTMRVRTGHGTVKVGTKKLRSGAYVLHAALTAAKPRKRGAKARTLKTLTAKVIVRKPRGR